MKRITRDDFLLKVIINADTGCWEWVGLIGSHGYGFYSYEGKQWLAHRVSYLLHKKGKLIPGKHLDHTCHSNDETCLGGECAHRRCVNPDHLEQVTPLENTMRGRTPAAENAKKIHCPRGHEYNSENTYFIIRKGRNRPERYCKLCQIENKRVRRQRVLEDRKAKGIVIKMGPALKMYCKRGHPRSGDNLHIGPTGIRYCRICCALSSARYRVRKKSQSI